MPSLSIRNINLHKTPYLHYANRCVRNAYLSGIDPATNLNCDHRALQIEKRLHQLSNAFCIQLIAYCIRQKGYHIGLYINLNEAHNLTQYEICYRWHQIYKTTPITAKFIQGDKLNRDEKKALSATLQLWQERLLSISWFMKSLNERIAHEANIEDGCRGVFWESNQPLKAFTDQPALIENMANIDFKKIS